MGKITVTETENRKNNLFYIQSDLTELFALAECVIDNKQVGNRAIMTIICPDKYEKTVREEILDKLSEVIAVNYKYNFFKNSIHLTGLNETEKEILIASLIAADLDEDKKYTFEKIKNLKESAIDGIFNFRLLLLKKKWEDIVSYIPPCFINSQLKDFISYLLENNRKKIYIDGGKVYDSHYKRLKRTALLGGEKVSLVREVLLSNCGEIHMTGNVSEEDEYYLKEYYSNKIIFSDRYFN